MLSTLKCGLKKRILHLSTCLITTPRTETFQANHWVYFPRHTAEISQILRTLVSSRKQAPGGLMAWWEVASPAPGRMRRISACRESHWAAGVDRGNHGNQNWSSHQIISDWKFWEVSYRLCLVSHRFFSKACNVGNWRLPIPGSEGQVHVIVNTC